jgi:hypothetical protein
VIHRRMVYLLLSCTLLSAAATVQASDTPDQSTSLADVKQQSAEAIQALKSYSVDQREKALEKGREALEAIDTRINAIERRTRAQWGQLSESARAKRDSTLRALRNERNRLSEWYGAMQHSSSGAWNEVKDGFINAYHTLGDSFGKAASEFNNESGSTNRDAE